MVITRAGSIVDRHQWFGARSLTFAKSSIWPADAFGTPTGIATASGQVCLGRLGDGISRVDSGLVLTPVAIKPGGTFDYGLWGNPVNAYLIASTSAGLVDIDPTTGVWLQIGAPGVFVDGVSVSPDGPIAYGAYTGDGSLRGCSLTSPNPSAPVFNHFVDHGLDGTGVISGGKFNGYIIVNNNDGTVGLMDHVTGVESIIADRGSRGDLVSPD